MDYRLHSERLVANGVEFMAVDHQSGSETSVVLRVGDKVSFAKRCWEEDIGDVFYSCEGIIISVALEDNYIWISIQHDANELAKVGIISIWEKLSPNAPLKPKYVSCYY